MTNQSTTTKEALEPCPFHAPDADWPPMLVRFPNRALDKDVWCVKCAECEARTATYTSADTARGKWNSRASAPIVAPVVDALCTALETAINTVECASIHGAGEELPWYKQAHAALKLAGRPWKGVRHD